MKETPFYFEVKDVITQFVAAFNDVVIKRYNSNRDVRDKIQVRYVYSPKQRALHNLLNKSEHITLPAVVVNIDSLERDESRVFNKIRGTIEQHANAEIPKTEGVDKIPSPIPVNISVNMSILGRYQTDIDQIISNFVPYSNPYIVISWKLPTDLATLVQEIRSEVLWSGNISFDYPTDINSNQPARISADTTFTIKSWLFPAGGTKAGPNIFYINTSLQPMSAIQYL